MSVATVRIPITVMQRVFGLLTRLFYKHGNLVQYMGLWVEVPALLRELNRLGCKPKPSDFMCAECRRKPAEIFDWPSSVCEARNAVCEDCSGLRLKRFLTYICSPDDALPRQ